MVHKSTLTVEVLVPCVILYTGSSVFSGVYGPSNGVKSEGKKSCRLLCIVQRKSQRKNALADLATRIMQCARTWRNFQKGTPKQVPFQPSKAFTLKPEDNTSPKFGPSRYKATIVGGPHAISASLALVQVSRGPQRRFQIGSTSPEPRLHPCALSPRILL